MAPKTGSKKLVGTWRPERDLDCSEVLSHMWFTASWYRSLWAIDVGFSILKRALLRFLRETLELDPDTVMPFTEEALWKYFQHWSLRFALTSASNFVSSFKLFVLLQFSIPCRLEAFLKAVCLRQLRPNSKVGTVANYFKFSLAGTSTYSSRFQPQLLLVKSTSTWRLRHSWRLHLQPPRCLLSGTQSLSWSSSAWTRFWPAKDSKAWAFCWQEKVIASADPYGTASKDVARGLGKWWLRQFWQGSSPYFAQQSALRGRTGLSKQRLHWKGWVSDLMDQGFRRKSKILAALGIRSKNPFANCFQHLGKLCHRAYCKISWVNCNCLIRVGLMTAQDCPVNPREAKSGGLRKSRCLQRVGTYVLNILVNHLSALTNETSQEFCHLCCIYASLTEVSTLVTWRPQQRTSDPRRFTLAAPHSADVEAPEVPVPIPAECKVEQGEARGDLLSVILTRTVNPQKLRMEFLQVRQRTVMRAVLWWKGKSDDKGPSLAGFVECTSIGPFAFLLEGTPRRGQRQNDVCMWQNNHSKLRAYGQVHWWQSDLCDLSKSDRIKNARAHVDSPHRKGKGSALWFLISDHSRLPHIHSWKCFFSVLRLLAFARSNHDYSINELRDELHASWQSTLIEPSSQFGSSWPVG